jgi:dCMP deaminase
MFIGITGTVCAGKSLVETYLEEECGFERVEACFPECRGEDGRWNSMLLMNKMLPQWRHHYVFGEIQQLDSLEPLRKRPFFLLIAVDAPLLQRYQRYKDR